MRGKLFKHMFLVAMSVFVACTALFMWSLYSYFTEARQSEQREETAYAAAAVEEGGKTFLQTKLPKDSANRITWIDRDGTVLFDSVAKAEDMENHADRDEVKQAMETGEGESTRYSSTLSRKTTNYALRLDDGTILRLSGTRSCAPWCGASADRTNRSSTRWRRCVRRTSSRTSCAESSPPTCLTS